MKVTGWKNVEVEVEVDIEPEHILSEFRQRADEAEATYWRRLVPALDAITQILADVKDEVIEALPAEARTILRERLQVQADRYK